MSSVRFRRIPSDACTYCRSQNQRQQQAKTDSGSGYRPAIQSPINLPFKTSALDRHGAQVGAIAGYSWARMAEIKQLWVAETHRGKGLAPALSQGFDQVEARWLQSGRPI
jgi:hypothetical protein